MAKLIWPVEEAAEVEAAVAGSVNSLSQFLSNKHQEWSRTIDSVIIAQMDQPLISQVPFELIFYGPGFLHSTDFCLHASGGRPHFLKSIQESRIGAAADAIVDVWKLRHISLWIMSRSQHHSIFCP